MNVLTEISSRRRDLLHPCLEALAQAQGDAGRQVAVAVVLAGGPDAGVLDVGQVDVVAGDPDLDAPFGQLGRHLGGDVGEELHDPRRHGAAQHLGDALGRLGHRVVTELTDADHVGAQPIHHQ